MTFAILDQQYVPEHPVEGLTEHPENPRRGDDESVAESVDTWGFFGAILVQRSTGHVIAGNTRLRVAQQAGSAHVPAFVLDVDDDTARGILLADNRMSDLATYDEGLLVAALQAMGGDLTGTGYTEDDLDDLVATLAKATHYEGEGTADDPHQQAAGSLADRFLVAPMSVLNARSGEWMERKRLWRGRGLADAEGRLGGLTYVGANRFADHYEHKRRVEGILGHEISTAEAEKYLERMATNDLAKTGTSAFDPVLAEVLLSWYSPENGWVLDPFAGGPTRGIMSAWLGRHYAGVDLRPEQVLHNLEQASVLLDPDTTRLPLWWQGDSTALETWARLPEGCPEEFDMVLTCPPYADLEQYSDDPADLSNMDVSGWDAGQEAALRHAITRLRPGGFAAVVIGEARGGPANTLYGLVGATQRHLQDAGCDLVAHYIMLTPVGGARLVVARQFAANRSPARVHQHVLVARKAGGPARVADQWGLLQGVEDALANVTPDMAEDEEPGE